MNTVYFTYNEPTVSSDGQSNNILSYLLKVLLSAETSSTGTPLQVKVLLLKTTQVWSRTF